MPMLGQYLRVSGRQVRHSLFEKLHTIFHPKIDLLSPKLCRITDFFVERIFFSPTTIYIVKDPKKRSEIKLTNGNKK
jgi:hypothetical protein